MTELSQRHRATRVQTKHRQANSKVDVFYEVCIPKASFRVFILPLSWYKFRTDGMVVNMGKSKFTSTLQIKKVLRYARYIMLFSPKPKWIWLVCPRQSCVLYKFISKPMIRKERGRQHCRNATKFQSFTIKSDSVTTNYYGTH